MSLRPFPSWGAGLRLARGVAPDELWQLVVQARVGDRSGPGRSLGIEPALVLARDAKRTPTIGRCTDRGGYVQGFERFSMHRASRCLRSRSLHSSPLFHWLLYAGAKLCMMFAFVATKLAPVWWWKPFLSLVFAFALWADASG